MKKKNAIDLASQFVVCMSIIYLFIRGKCIFIKIKNKHTKRERMKFERKCALQILLKKNHGSNFLR